MTTLAAFGPILTGTAPPAARAAARTAVLTCVRNEGLWLVEWIAYHRAIGFDDIFVVSNDCTDGSDLLLDRLAAQGWVRHLRSIVPAGQSPQEAGCALALSDPSMAVVDWVLHIDADEFLHVTAGAGLIGDLLAAVGEADAIALCWRMFGSGGRRLWAGGSVLQTFTRCESWLKRGRSLQKCAFRPREFGRVYSHMPKAPRRPDVVLKNSEGRVMPNDALFHPRHVRHKSAEAGAFTWANACIHHYAIRSLDVFLLKNERGDGLGLEHRKYLRGSAFWNQCERNASEDRSILRHWPAVAEAMARMRADPVVSALETRALAEFAALRQRVLIKEHRYGWDDPTPKPDAAEKEDAE